MIRVVFTSQAARLLSTVLTATPQINENGRILTIQNLNHWIDCQNLSTVLIRSVGRVDDHSSQIWW